MGCAAPRGGASLDGIDLSTVALIQGVIVKEQVAASNAYVRLLDVTGEFTAEMQTSKEGQFRFFAAPGSWSVRVITASGSVDYPVTAALGKPVDLALSI